LTVEDLSLHILDVAENSIAAGATRVEICVDEATERDLLTIEIRDNGRGMDAETMKTAIDPFFTTKTVRRVGLGLPFFKQAAEECEGHFSLTSENGKGTTVAATFRRSHIDRKPLGDMGASMMVLIAGNPDIDILFTYRRDDYTYQVDTREIREELGEVPMNSPEVLKLIRDDIDKGLKG
jgi:anti-sigma regulatory factor (Ser/Thr protein kinase)